MKLILMFALGLSGQFAAATESISQYEHRAIKMQYKISAIKTQGKRFLKIHAIGTVTTPKDSKAVFIKDTLLPISSKVELDPRGMDSMDLSHSNSDLDLATGDFYNTKNQIVEELFDTYDGEAKGIGVGVAYHANSQATSPGGIQFHDMSSGGIFGGVMWANGVGVGVRQTPFSVTLKPVGKTGSIKYELIEHVRGGYASQKESKTVDINELLRSPLPVIKKKTYPIVRFGL